MGLACQGDYVGTEETLGPGGGDEGDASAVKLDVGGEVSVRLAGTNGHDTVGGLMPLPLWPTVALAQGATSAKSGNRRRRPCCSLVRQSGGCNNDPRAR